jgi:nitrogen fixation protein NifU and related proteins
VLLKDKLGENIFKKHFDSPFHYALMDESDFHIEEKNILCGDSIEFFLKQKDSKIAEISFQASSCSIAKVSASILLELTQHKTKIECREFISEFKMRMKSEDDFQYFNSLDSLLDLKKYPTRLNCVLLAWNGLEKLLEKSYA